MLNWICEIKTSKSSNILKEVVFLFFF